MNISKEEESFHSMSKLVNGEVPLHLRRLFRERWNQNYPQELWHDNKTDGKNMWDKITPNEQAKIKQNIKEKIKSGNSDQWDCTVLFTVLLSSDLELIPCHEHEKIDNLRKIKNISLSHPKNSKMSQKDFEKNIVTVKNVLEWIYNKLGETDEYKRISDVINSFEKASLHTQDLKKLETQIKEERDAAIKENHKDFQDLPGKVENFVGREKEINDVIECLKNDETEVCYDVVLIHGEPCLGKTAFALNLAHKMLENGFNYVIWIDMRDISNINGPDDVPNMETLAVKILREFKIYTDSIKDEPLQYLEQKFRTITEQGKKTFLIFDNADSLISSYNTSVSNDTLDKLIKLVQSTSDHNIKMAFTSRIRKDLGQETKYVKINKLDDEESNLYLQLSLKEETLLPRDKLIIMLKDKCEGMPLALKTISSNVNSAEDKAWLEDYLEDFDKDSKSF